MSTICTDRQLPTILNDYGKPGATETVYGDMLFDRLQKYVSINDN